MPGGNRALTRSDGRCPGFDVKFLENVADVLFHRAAAYAENGRDFPIPFALNDPVHYLTLPRG